MKITWLLLFCCLFLSPAFVESSFDIRELGPKISNFYRTNVTPYVSKALCKLLHKCDSSAPSQNLMSESQNAGTDKEQRVMSSDNSGSRRSMTRDHHASDTESTIPHSPSSGSLRHFARGTSQNRASEYRDSKHSYQDSYSSESPAATSPTRTASRRLSRISTATFETAPLSQRSPSPISPSPRHSTVSNSIARGISSPPPAKPFDMNAANNGIIVDDRAWSGFCRSINGYFNDARNYADLVSGIIPGTVKKICAGLGVSKQIRADLLQSFKEAPPTDGKTGDQLWQLGAYWSLVGVTGKFEEDLMKSCEKATKFSQPIGFNDTIRAIAKRDIVDYLLYDNEQMVLVQTVDDALTAFSKQLLEMDAVKNYNNGEKSGLVNIYRLIVYAKAYKIGPDYAKLHDQFYAALVASN